MCSLTARCPGLNHLSSWESPVLCHFPLLSLLSPLPFVFIFVHLPLNVQPVKRYSGWGVDFKVRQCYSIIILEGDESNNYFYCVSECALKFYSDR